MAERIKFDHAGLREALRSVEMRHVVQEATDRIADHVRAQGIKVGDEDGGPLEVPLPVEATVILTDRAHGRVLLKHPAGIAVQAKHGALTKAASAAGLHVKGA